MAAQIQAALIILRRRQLEAKIGIKRTAIYDRLNPKSKSYDPSFPKPIKLGSGNGRHATVGWLEGEVDAWLTAQIEKSRSRADRSVA